MNNEISGAELLVDCLTQHGVEYVFGIPGAKIDAVFNALADVDRPRLIVCRHEQNAAFMAACVGKLTGTPGVALVTSGPGVGNLATGLITATTEGDPLLAIGGAVPRSMKLKQTHQSMDNVAFATPLTKQSVEIAVAESIPEIVSNAFRLAKEPRQGAVFLSLPVDVGLEKVAKPTWHMSDVCPLGAPPTEVVARAAERIQNAKLPVLLLGMEATKPETIPAVHRLLEKFPLATIETFQAAGALSKELAQHFVGRLGIWRNQPGDHLLAAADLVVTVGFDPVEYDPETWNAEGRLDILHIGDDRLVTGHKYHPSLELRGGIAATLEALAAHLPAQPAVADPELVTRLKRQMDDRFQTIAQKPGAPIHPLRFIHDLQSAVDENTTVIGDVGSHYMWLARHLYCYQPQHLLFSNGQQTLGVALPWAMATTLVKPHEKVISISGDGGFLFSAMELETAVRENMHFVHFVWRDGHYNMVQVQEEKKYGRRSGVDFGRLDLVKFAEGFGATGMAITSADEILPALEAAQRAKGPVLIDVPIDYSDNASLFEDADVYHGA